ncbi:MAG: 5'-methylthioadenosine/adenosylhomocysteine nucleosidase [Bacteroides sp.]|nr:5'-methylthioadenosine/adenosylhomocysteine nucleosidase [Bacteroides sp.]
MKILILSAMDKELSLVLELMENVKEVSADGLKIFEGKIAGHDVVAAKCGIGKVNSALNTLRIVRAESPDLVINSGVAGGADPSMKVGSLLVADGVAYHDVWCGPGTEVGTADGFPRIMTPAAEVVRAARENISDDKLRFGLICSGDRFISTAEEVARIKDAFPEALACDMESASIAQTCILCGIPFAVVRVVSDTPGQAENISQYENFWGEAPLRTFEAVKTILHNL